jgi:uncharacterized protein (TIGR00266 family)
VQIQLRHQPSFSVARCLLGPNEPIRAEAGAMMAMTPDTQIEAKAQGGVMKSLKRAALGGESFFVTTLTAGPSGGWVDLAASLPGDLSVVDLVPGRPWLLSKGSFLGAAASVNLETKFQGLKMFAGGEGAFLMEVEGEGPMVVSAFGAIDRFRLEDGHRVVVDSDHFVAAEMTVQYTVRRAAERGLIQSAKSGEGLVFEFAGPGEVMIQTRNPRSLITYLAANGLGARN